MTLMCLLLGVTLAAEPTVEPTFEPTVEADGTSARGTAILDLPPDRILAALQDPTWEGSFSDDGTTVAVTARDGTCQTVAYESPHPLLTATYELRRCPTADGWTSTLIRSNSFETYQSRWRVTPEADGTRLSYEVALTPSVRWVPSAVVRSELKRGISSMLRGITSWARSQPRPTRD